MYKLQAPLSNTKKVELQEACIAAFIVLPYICKYYKPNLKVLYRSRKSVPVQANKYSTY